MDKYIGFDIDNKKTVACVVQKRGKTSYEQQPSKPLVLLPCRVVSRIFRTFCNSDHSGLRCTIIYLCLGPLKGAERYRNITPPPSHSQSTLARALFNHRMFMYRLVPHVLPAMYLSRAAARETALFAMFSNEQRSVVDRS